MDTQTAPEPLDRLDEGLDEGDILRIVESRHDAPHRVLGPHLRDRTSTLVRAFLPHADRAYLRIQAEPPRDWVMQRIHPAGLFAATVPLPCARDYELLAVAGDGTVSRQRDAYAFVEPVFTGEDERLFVSGRHDRLFDILGAHPARSDGVDGVRFGVWAPAALRVSVVGTFNGWDGRSHPMIRTGKAGVWVLFLPGALIGHLYKYEIKTADGAVFLKPDPFARRAEPPPGSASTVQGRLLQEDRGFAALWPAGGEPALAVRVLEPGNPVPAEVLLALKAAGCSHVGLPEAPSGGRFAFGCLARGAAAGDPEALAATVEACHRLLLPTPH
jgi:1,4-alpha-glucan branching enzyme